NVGVNAADAESIDGKPHVAGFVLRDASPPASSWRSEQTLDAYLAEHGVGALSGVDPRKPTRHLPDHGAQNGAIGPGPVDRLLRMAREAAGMAGLDLVRRVTPKERYTFTEGRGAWRVAQASGEATPARGREHHVVAVDFGVKKSILRCL